MATALRNINFGLGLLSSFGPNVDVVGIYANGAGSGASATSGISSSIINSIIGGSSVAASFGQMFANARPLKATIRETAKVMEHPTETGVMLADHKIINPVEIDLPLIITNSSGSALGALTGSVAENYAITYSQIRQAWVNSTPLTVKTRVGTFSNMIIANMPHEENAEMLDAITIFLQLRQVLFVLPGTNTPVPNFQPADPLNTSTIANGLQSAIALSQQLISTASGVSSYAAVRKFL